MAVTGWIHESKGGGSGAVGAQVHGAIGAPPLGTTGSAYRAGWFRGSF